MNEIDELKQRINALEQEIARLLPYRERYLFLESHPIDVIHIDPDPEINLPRSVQLQVSQGDVDPGTAKPVYSLIAMAPTLSEAIAQAIAQHGVEVQE